MTKSGTMSFWGLLKSGGRIVLPMIQRDYAQGRADDASKLIRKEFIEALWGAISGGDRASLKLDFIFGESNVLKEVKTFFPYDGQQRLTTLYLLHWYAAMLEIARGGMADEAVKRLGQFLYEAREGATMFGQKLVELLTDEEFRNDFISLTEGDSLATLIEERNWFLREWRLHDPTVSGMLVMLDCIHGKFRNSIGLWGKLTGDAPPITFFFEELCDLSLQADDIYIKMNARGKLLTEFERFKAKLIGHIEKTPLPASSENPQRLTASEISQKLDNDWLRLFWKTVPDEKTGGNRALACDQGMTNFFNFASEMLLHWPEEKNKESSEADDSSNEDQVAAILAVDHPFEFNDTLEFLTTNLNRLYKLSEGSPETPDGIGDQFRAFFSGPWPEEGRINLFKDETDLFRLICYNPSKASLADKLMFLAFVLFLTKDNVEEGAARQRLRILRNILYEGYLVREKLHHLIKVTFHLMTSGLGTTLDASWKKSQLGDWKFNEERAKSNLRGMSLCSPALAAAMDRLEDHPVHRGRLPLFCQTLGLELITDEYRPLIVYEDKKHNSATLLDPKAIMLGGWLFGQALGMDKIDSDDLLRILLCQDVKIANPGHHGYRNNQRFMISDGPTNGWRHNYPDNKGWRRIFSEDADYNHNYSFTRKVVLALAEALQKETDPASPDAKAAISTIIERWLADREKQKMMDWRYYFVKYDWTRPKAGKEFYNNASGVYEYQDDKPCRNFEMVALKGIILSGQHWNPFLLAAWKEFKDGAGHDLEESSVLKGICRDDNNSYLTRPLILPESSGGLTLWSDERGWRLCPEDRKAMIDDPQKKQFLKMINKKNNIKVNEENGLIFVDGKDYDGKNPYRIYDTIDRIKYIQPLLEYIYIACKDN